ncbi:MAG: hypothetical protein JWM78_1213 [Verrucomicrobiaceae bacterium]|nr:hypothetical protein [Verrucomicrobiaceae bacterium]
MKFCTVIHSLKSPENVGMIVRSHLAHNGEEIIFTGNDLPWVFKKGSQAFSRKLEKQAVIVHIKDPVEAIKYARNKEFSPLAIEISENSEFINKFSFPNRAALIVGNESEGLSKSFLALCDAVVTIPQYGGVGSLNVAVSASIAMYEFMRTSSPAMIIGDEYA